MQTFRLTFVSILCAFWCVSAPASDRNGALDWSKLPAEAKARIVQLAKLTASDGLSGDSFGFSVAISENVIVVGIRRAAAYVFVKPASGWQDMTQTAKLTDSSGLQDSFGYSVAISGNIIVVGAPFANQGQGVAYAFVKPAEGWHDMTQTATLVASDGTPGDHFGESVSVSGDVAIVGAFEATVNGNPYQGAAYVYTQPAMESANANAVTLTETAKLTASDGAEVSFFGGAVSISGNTVAVGAQDGNGGTGEAYVFVQPQSGWTNMTETAELKPSDDGGQLGASIATNGSTVVAGAPSAGSSRRVKGAAYVFVEPASGWTNMTETAQLQASTELGPLGSSVAVDATGQDILAGSPTGYGNRDNSGQVCVFVQPPGGWLTTSKDNLTLFSSDGQFEDYFGFSISLSGQTLLVGAYGAEIGSNPGQGAAYVFGEQ